MYDPLALARAQQALRVGDDAFLSAQEQQFMYMPFTHSESLLIQRRSLDLVRTLGNDEATKYAQAHHDTIERFGRLPHRNRDLGRNSTEEELDFIKKNPVFGLLHAV